MSGGSPTTEGRRGKGPCLIQFSQPDTAVPLIFIYQLKKKNGSEDPVSYPQKGHLVNSKARMQTQDFNSQLKMPCVQDCLRSTESYF